MRASRRVVVVLDDDPTGTQTVHDVPVLTRWEESLLTRELECAETVLYILTNSRSLPPASADALNQELGARLVRAARKVGRDLRIISRSDSTLRGHYPLEIKALYSALAREGQNSDAHLLVPCLVEGGRMTIDAIHWLCEGTALVPSAETEFARDPDFGYTHSDLRAWVEEKTRGAWRAHEVMWFSLDDVRRGPPALLSRLQTITGLTVTDAVTYRDLEVIVAALLGVERRGRNILYRTAASFVRVYGGIASQELLRADQLVPMQKERGGLIVAGSYTNKTTRQIEYLRQHQAVEPITLEVERILNDETRAYEIRRVTERAEDALKRGQNSLVYTSRAVVLAESHLEIGKRVSEALTRVIRGIATRPRFMIAKGGITSSNIATEGLGVKRARVLGQIAPGVPVWHLGTESRFPDLTYIVFPGNVGDDTTLASILAQLELPKC